MVLRPSRAWPIVGALLAGLVASAAAAPKVGKKTPKSGDPPGPAPAERRAVDDKLPADIFPLARIKPGMKGFGLTVFAGTKPEKFDFEVIAVLTNFLPKQDVVLVRSNDPKLLNSGFAQGMSGSPMFLDGKVAGAFSYAFRFSKDPIGAFTPVEYMLKDGRTPLRGPELTALASADEWHRTRGVEAFSDGRDTAARAREDNLAWAVRAPLPNLPTAPLPSERRLDRAGVPLSMSGFSGPAFTEAQKMFAPMGLEPMQASGGGDANSGPTKFELGGSIGVQLVRGDMSAVGTGTVSYLDGAERILAFGHPMFQMGEIYMPVVSATIHTFLPSVQISFKLSSPNRELGTLIQDRQSAIAALTNKRAEMIPVDIKIRGATSEPSEFHTQVVRHRFLTPSFVMMSVFSAIGVHATDVAQQTITMHSRLHVRGFEPLSFTDYVFAPDGVSGGALGAARALRAMTPLLFNPYGPVNIDRVEVDVDIAYKADYVELEHLALDEGAVLPGKPATARVTVMPYGQPRYEVPITFTVPRSLAGQVVRLEVSQGDSVRPDMAPPENLPQLVEILRKGTYPGNTMVLTVWRQDEGITIKGKVIADLPDSVLDTMKPGTSTRRGEPFRSAVRVVVPVNRVVEGRVDLSVKVKDLDEETK